MLNTPGAPSLRTVSGYKRFTSTNAAVTVPAFAVGEFLGRDLGRGACVQLLPHTQHGALGEGHTCFLGQFHSGSLQMALIHLTQRKSTPCAHGE
jgi:hypothetical protein